MAQGKSRIGKFISFSLAISSLYFSQKNLARVVFKDRLHGFAQRIVMSWTRRASFYVYYSRVEGAYEYRFRSSLLPSLRTSLRSSIQLLGIIRFSYSVRLV